MVFGITPKRFAKLLKEGKEGVMSKQVDKFKVKQLQDLSFSDYVDLKRHFANEDYHNFFRIFVDKKWYQVVYMHHSLAIAAEFKRQKDEIEESNYWIFNPPQYGEPSKESEVSKSLRADFVEEFGNDVIIVDVIMRWSNCSYKEVEQWKVSEVMFWGNYLYGQRIVEGVK
jgi:hypothetical protein